MYEEDIHRLVVLGELVDQIASGAGAESLRRHRHAIVPLRPFRFLERLREALLLDIDNLVVEPGWPFVVLDYQRAEHDRFADMRVVDRTARLAVHTLDFAVLVLVVGDDALEVSGGQRFADLVMDDLANDVEHLAFVESKFSVAADGNDGVIEIVEDDILLRYTPSGGRAVRFSDCLSPCGHDCREERLQNWLLPVAGDRHVGGRDVDRDEKLRLAWCLRDVVRESAAKGVDVALVAGGVDFAGDWCAIHTDE